MTYDDVTKHLLSLPGAELSIQWGDDHVFKVGGKMFAAMGPKKLGPQGMSFKADEMGFELLTKKRGIIPAPYLARAQWVRIDKLDRLPAKQLKGYLTRAHALAAGKLPKKTRLSLGLLDDA
ncbi:MAG TPA: MmcQ/YjbR family DNA-binding protein [Rhizomicrobium sp.]|jgi:predicted DNA-binding protein (MmcQ/YjbR family)|nr:MmcQ/YjbR family DNA-binding protein [Rhizomicrobium sp.]